MYISMNNRTAIEICIVVLAVIVIYYLWNSWFCADVEGMTDASADQEADESKNSDGSDGSDDSDDSKDPDDNDPEDTEEDNADANADAEAKKEGQEAAQKVFSFNANQLMSPTDFETEELNAYVAFAHKHAKENPKSNLTCMNNLGNIIDYTWNKHERYPRRIEDGYPYRQKFDNPLEPPFLMSKLNPSTAKEMGLQDFHKIAHPARTIYNKLLSEGQKELKNEKKIATCKQDCLGESNSCSSAECYECQEKCEADHTQTIIFCAQFNPLIKMHSFLLRFAYLIVHKKHSCFRMKKGEEIGHVREIYDQVKASTDELEKIKRKSTRKIFGMSKERREDNTGAYIPVANWNDLVAEYSCIRDYDKANKLVQCSPDGNARCDPTGTFQCKSPDDPDWPLEEQKITQRKLIDHVVQMIKDLLSYYINALRHNTLLNPEPKTPSSIITFIEAYNNEFTTKVLQRIFRECLLLDRKEAKLDEVNISGYVPAAPTVAPTEPILSGQEDGTNVPLE